MSHRPYFQGGRRGGSGGRSGGRGGQQWWEPAWRAERLRQKAAEMEVMDQNEWWGKLEQKKRGGEREMVIRRNFIRDDHQILGKALVVSKLPLPNYHADLDELHGSNKKEINIMSMETETRVGNLLNTSNGTTYMGINSSTSADTATVLAKTVEIGTQAPMLKIETGLNELNIELKQKQEKMRESDSVKAMLLFREKLLAFKMKSKFLKAVSAEQDDDAPLLRTDDVIKLEASQCVNRLVSRFVDLVKSLVCHLQELVPGPRQRDLFLSFLTDLLWATQIAPKLEISIEFIRIWVDALANIVKISEQSCPMGELNGIKVKALEVTTKVVEAIAYGTVVLAPIERLHMVKIWLPYIRLMKPLTDSFSSDEDNNLLVKFDCELRRSLESSLVSIILTLPSGDQAEILREWLNSKEIRYPDLTEAFEVWCYRSKVSKRRLALFDGSHLSTSRV